MTPLTCRTQWFKGGVERDLEPHRNAVDWPTPLTAASAAAGWSASTAIPAAYAAPAGELRGTAPTTSADAFDRAAHHGDEHVVKLGDTALDAYSWTGDDLALASVETATLLIDSA